MNPVIDRIARELEQQGREKESYAVRLVQRHYRDLNLAQLIALLREATEADSPLARLRYMDDLVDLLERAAGVLGQPPVGLAQEVRDAVERGITATAQMLAAQQTVTAAFVVPPTLQLEWMDLSEARMREFWGAEPPRFVQEVRAALRLGLERGQSHQEMAARIRDRVGVSRSRAVLIARDSIGSAAGFAMRESQRQAGCTQYVWRSASDGRVRPEHKARNGKVFDWDKPPSDGHPGEPINCRCVALAVLSGSSELA